MNSTVVIKLVTNSSTLEFESWFIPLDILVMLCSVFTIGFATFFLLIILIDKTCHTVLMMLTANSYLAKLIYGSDLLSVAVFTLHNDLKQIQYQDSLCSFRGYLGYAAYGIMNYSFLLQAFYRYVTVVYPRHLFLQSIRFQFLLICITWIITCMYPFGFLLTDQIIYNADNQMCQVHVQLSFAMIFLTVCIYIIPVALIMLIYFKLIQYIKEMSKRVTPVNTLIRAQRELKMFRRIIILITILIVLGVPYAVFILMSFFTAPPKYHLRIAFSAIYISLVCVIITSYKFTEPLIASIMKLRNRRVNRVTAIVTFVNQ